MLTQIREFKAFVFETFAVSNILPERIAHLSKTYENTTIIIYGCWDWREASLNTSRIITDRKFSQAHFYVDTKTSHPSKTKTCWRNPLLVAAYIGNGQNCRSQKVTKKHYYSFSNDCEKGNRQWHWTYNSISCSLIPNVYQC